MDFFQKIIAVWRNVNIVQRALLIAIALTVAAGAFLLFRWSRRPDMKLLYRDLAPDEASKITDKISERDIPYELKRGGTAIYVPQEHVYQLRLDMAKEGLPEGSQKGYKIFDNAKIGVSPKVQDINLQRALQEELAKSIQMIDGVLHARVHIVTPEHSIFTSDQSSTTASVALRIRPGYELSSSSIAAITHLVAGAVESLKPENVTVVDSNGRLLSRRSDQAFDNGATTVADYRERVEHNLAKKAEDMLIAVLGPDRASVKVSAEIDMTSSNFVTEKYDPKGVPTKEEIESTTETKPAPAAKDNEPAGNSGKKAGETIVTEYVIGKTVEQRTIMPGDIKSLAVAAFVDLTPDNADPNNPEAAAPIVELAEVEQIIKNALGLKDTDSLKVVQARFNRPIAAMPEEQPSNWPRYMAIARNASLGIMAICALLVLKIFGGASKKAAKGTAQAELPAGAEAAALMPAQASEPLMLRRQIASALQNNPDQVKRLFSSWVEEKE
jgi:flagellar M-ring protein FliF